MMSMMRRRGQPRISGKRGAGEPRTAAMGAKSDRADVRGQVLPDEARSGATGRRKFRETRGSSGPPAVRRMAVAIGADSSYSSFQRATQGSPNRRKKHERHRPTSPAATVRRDA